ncbi:3TM-type holin [Skermanella stibiiresistens]|nr:3TM-type holin [Skermanella stibiiresistens]
MSGTGAGLASEDAYVRRMRPTFGYVMALTWLAQMGAIAWVIVTDPAQAIQIIAAMASLGTIWTVGLGVLGVYVYRRSGEKRASQGGAPKPSY